MNQRERQLREDSGRLRIIKFSGQMLEDILRCKLRDGRLFRGFTSDAPDDLKLMHWRRYCAEDNTYEFVVWSSTFDLLPEGTALPDWCPAFTPHYEERDVDAA